MAWGSGGGVRRWPWPVNRCYGHSGGGATREARWMVKGCGMSSFRWQVGVKRTHSWRSRHRGGGVCDVVVLDRPPLTGHPTLGPHGDRAMPLRFGSSDAPATAARSRPFRPRLPPCQQLTHVDAVPLMKFVERRQRQGLPVPRCRRNISFEASASTVILGGLHAGAGGQSGVAVSFPLRAHRDPDPRPPGCAMNRPN